MTKTPLLAPTPALSLLETAVATGGLIKCSCNGNKPFRQPLFDRLGCTVKTLIQLFK